MNNPFDPVHIQEEKAEREARRLKLRTNLLIALFCAVLAGFAAVLYQVQMVDGASYRASTNSHTIEPEQVDSVRGEILDRYGRKLVTNEVSYNVELDWDAMGRARVEILTRLLEICREEGVEWADSLPISKTAPWTYTTDSPLSYQWENDDGETETGLTNLGALAQEKRGWVEDAAEAPPTAAGLLAAMCEDFGLIEEGEAPGREERELAGVLYELYLRQHEVVNSVYVFAQGVEIPFISKVKENSLAGVRVVTATTRRYETGYAAHVLGFTGAITKANMEYYSELGYPMNATVGRDGVELAFEERLHGTSGTRLIEKDQDGNIVSQEWKTKPAPGDHAVLTIDLALQATTEDLLAQYAAKQEKPGGMAAAVVDMTGGVLALASYPTYDLSSFLENYNDLLNDPDRPMLNRAVKGRYSPGSTFKMLTAIAALDTGTITPAERVECTGTYTFYAPSYTPNCWYGWGHGQENVTRAITDSCNVFFYDVGRRTTIAKLNEYAQKFGLGEYTGIELAEEKGLRAGPETSKQFDQQWYDGDTLSAAIGQGNNLFTPLQLANYVATLVNGGNNYQCHLLKEYKSSDYSMVTEVYEPKLMNSIEIQPEHLAAVKQGMYNLSQTAGMARYFSSLPVAVGCKTGTAETQSHAVSTNAIFVCFAPYDDPQVALCLVAEEGASGANLAEIAAGILAQYFSTDSSLSAVTGENVLLR